MADDPVVTTSIDELVMMDLSKFKLEIQSEVYHSVNPEKHLGILQDETTALVYAEMKKNNVRTRLVLILTDGSKAFKVQLPQLHIMDEAEIKAEVTKDLLKEMTPVQKKFLGLEIHM